VRLHAIFTFHRAVLTTPQRPTLLFLDSNMCTQDVRKWSNCGCTVKLEVSKIATKKEQTIARALRIIRFHIGQVGAVTINMEEAGISGRNESYWDYVFTKSF
jgi:hypothetical protein